MAMYSEGVSQEFQMAILRKVFEAVQLAHKQHLKPVVVLDLDLCVLEPYQRTLAALQHIGELSNIVLFRQPEFLPILPAYNSRAFLNFVDVINSPELSRCSLEQRKAMAQRFREAMFRDDMQGRQGGQDFLTIWYGQDKLSTGVKEFIQAVQEYGGSIVFNSARPEWKRQFTQKSLEAYGFSDYLLQLHPISEEQRIGTSEQKALQVEWLKEKGCAVIAFFDDDPNNVDAVMSKSPDTIGVVVSLKGYSNQLKQETDAQVNHNKYVISSFVFESNIFNQSTSDEAFRIKQRDDQAPSMVSPADSKTIGIIGAGIAGSTIALMLTQKNVKVKLFEANESILNGPPMCHLHAGGSLYPEIPIDQCLKLLEQSVEMIRMFPYAINYRPTVVLFPTGAAGDPQAFIGRLQKIEALYADLVAQDPKNEVLGKADDFFKIYQESDIQHLSTLALPSLPLTLDDWLVPVSKAIDLKSFKLPLIMVKEPGMSLFRIAATVKIAIEQNSRCEIYTHTPVKAVTRLGERRGWKIWIAGAEAQDKKSVEVDYLINAAGYQSGIIDDWTGIKHKRKVEFKASYMAQWKSCRGLWPEVIFPGERGTPFGMAQLTPYQDNFFKLHGMTEEITLFKGGLSDTPENSSQPLLEQQFNEDLMKGMTAAETDIRTRRAIDYIAQFIPDFKEAVAAGVSLFGAQQIPGTDASLRAADVFFHDENYADVEIVKATSAMAAANKVLDRLIQVRIIEKGAEPADGSVELTNHTLSEILASAQEIAKRRGVPKALADFYGNDMF